MGWRTKRTVVLPELPDHKEWLGINSASPRPPYRFWCVVFKFPSQKNGNREEHKKVGMTQGRRELPPRLPALTRPAPLALRSAGSCLRGLELPEGGLWRCQPEALLAYLCQCKQSHMSTDASAGEFPLHVEPSEKGCLLCGYHCLTIKNENSKHSKNRAELRRLRVCVYGEPWLLC